MGKHRRKRALSHRAEAILLTILLFHAGSAQAIAEPSTYSVKTGDTLMGIARRLFGTPSRWLEIYRLNEALIGPAPGKMRAGLNLQLPGEGKKTTRAAPAMTPKGSPISSSCLPPPPVPSPAPSSLSSQIPGKAPVAAPSFPPSNPGSLFARRPTISEWTLGYAIRNLSENYPAAGARSFTEGIPSFRSGCRIETGTGWDANLELEQWVDYSLDDPSLPESWHTRNETWFALQLNRKTFFPGGCSDWGLGYLLRTVRIGNRYLPSTPSYLFSEHQFYQGPLIRQQFEWHYSEGLKFIGGWLLSPLLISQLDEGIPPMGPLFGVGANIGIRTNIGNFTSEIAYQHQSLRRYQGSFQQFSGPALTLSAPF